ncbi:MAG: peptidoglycan editing factor PgeF [Gammaproteobacteria bacterium]|nr:peptidoglycan editing factor PgeF [Gammaproteobacteria bacterium]
MSELAARPAFLVPDWPAPARVRAAFSLRGGGVSAAPWASLNLGGHVGDDPAAVRENRRRLCEALALPTEPCWLDQVHGVEVVRVCTPPATSAPALAPVPKPAAAAASGVAGAPPMADASVTDRPGVVLAIMVADCIPVLFCDREGTIVGAAHAGWRGLAAGVLENTVAALGVAADRLLAWLGPAIGPVRFEVGSEVRDAFLASASGPQAAARFVPSPAGRWLCDLPGLARDRLLRLGITRVAGGELCTVSDPDRFFSHRRDAPRTGRMAALIWLQP